MKYIQIAIFTWWHSVHSWSSLLCNCQQVKNICKRLMPQLYCLSLTCTLTYSCLISFALVCRLQPIAHCSMHIFNVLCNVSLWILKLRGKSISINIPSNFWESMLKGIMTSLCIRSWNMSSSTLSNVSSKSSHLLFTLWPKYLGLGLSLLWKLFQAMRCVMHDRTCHMRMGIVMCRHTQTGSIVVTNPAAAFNNLH